MVYTRVTLIIRRAWTYSDHNHGDAIVRTCRLQMQCLYRYKAPYCLARSSALSHDYHGKGSALLDSLLIWM